MTAGQSDTKGPDGNGGKTRAHIKSDQMPWEDIFHTGDNGGKHFDLAKERL